MLERLCVINQLSAMDLIKTTEISTVEFMCWRINRNKKVNAFKNVNAHT